MNLNYSFLATAIGAIVLGIAIIVLPQILSYIIAVYLIVIGISGLIHVRNK
ncbi:MAG TPA: DUF3096 domain-containing protein [Anaerolineae bacterium]|nr:DUF3096 domain-containing protein [Anaerolineae bacterium]